MPANTPNGWPYILPADNVADYPATSQALATKADAAVVFAQAVGLASIPVGSAASYTKVVNFPPGLFTVAPAVVLSKTAAGPKFVPTVAAITKDSMTIQVATVDNSTGGTAATVSVWFHALQATAASAYTPGVSLASQEVDLSVEDDPDGLRLLLDQVRAAELADAG